METSQRILPRISNAAAHPRQLHPAHPTKLTLEVSSTSYVTTNTECSEVICIIFQFVERVFFHIDNPNISVAKVL